MMENNQERNEDGMDTVTNAIQERLDARMQATQEKLEAEMEAIQHKLEVNQDWKETKTDTFIFTSVIQPNCGSSDRIQSRQAGCQNKNHPRRPGRQSGIGRGRDGHGHKLHPRKGGD
jgi:phage terminase large subunit